jgi:hypothetical protein
MELRRRGEAHLGTLSVEENDWIDGDVTQR